MIDVSNYQGTIDWKLVRTEHRIAAIKACEGLYELDGSFHYNSVASRAHGVIPAAYFYAHPSESASAQARHFISVAHPVLSAGNGIPWLDIEVDEGKNDLELITWCREWFSIVDPIIRTQTILYTYSAFAPKFKDAFYNRPLAIANYDHEPRAKVPVGLWPWKNVVIHQYTDEGSCPGIRGKVDLDYRYGPLRKLIIPRAITRPKIECWRLPRW